MSSLLGDRPDRPVDAAPRSILPLRVREVVFAAGQRRLLDHVGFDVHAGERVVMLGPNGAGKSLLLRVCHGLVTPTAGSVQWSQPVRVARQAQAMVFQRPVLLRRSAQANIEYALKIARVARSVRAERARVALGQVGLASLAAQPARVLSGGEQQRVALARAAALGPQLLWLDEPTAHLDPEATADIERTVMTLNAQGTTIVMTTHDLGQARRIASRVLFLSAGALLDDMSATDFFRQPASEAAQRFLRGELFA